MSEPILDRGKLCQIGLIVRDIERVSKAYADLLGVEVPEPIVTDPVEKARTEYHGSRTDARAKLAFFDMGRIAIELIEPMGGDSTWQEFLDNHGEGVHHIAFTVEGMGQVVMDLKAKGMPLVQKGEYEGGRYAYIDSHPKLAVMLELLEND
ncbi:MAG: VOC family protein [Phycisphaerae bacterium]